MRALEIFRLPHLRSKGFNWVAVKELKLSYHNGFLGFRV